MARIGLQAMMVKDVVAELGPYEAFRRVSELGYRVVEFSQIPLTPATVSDLARARDDFALEFCSISAALAAGGANDALDDHFEKIVADARALGARLVRVGMIPVQALRSEAALADFARRAEDAALELEAEGLELYFHNHHVEFAKRSGRYLLDIIADGAPHVGLELDAHWIARGGLDPARVIANYAGRVRMVHLKDYRIAVPDESVFEEHALGNTASWWNEWRSLVQFAEVGEGNLDWTGIIDASLAAGAEYLLVEQDELYGRTVWESLEISHRNLTALGYGQLF